MSDSDLVKLTRAINELNRTFNKFTKVIETTNNLMAEHSQLMLETKPIDNQDG